MPVQGDSQILAKLAAWQKTMTAKAAAAMAEVAAALEAWAKAEQDPSDQAETNSITGQVTTVSAQIVQATLTAGMDSDVFQKLARDGQWSFLWPTLLNHQADIIAIIKRNMAI